MLKAHLILGTRPEAIKLAPVVLALRADPRFMALPIILVSTLDAPDDVAAGRAAGADAYVSKRELAGDVLARLAQRLVAGGRG